MRWKLDRLDSEARESNNWLARQCGHSIIESLSPVYGTMDPEAQRPDRPPVEPETK